MVEVHPPPDTSWAERAYFSGALDPSLGQAFSFFSLLQLRLRIESPLVERLQTCLQKKTLPLTPLGQLNGRRLALPVPVGLAEPPEVGTEDRSGT